MRAVFPLRPKSNVRYSAVESEAIVAAVRAQIAECFNKKSCKITNLPHITIVDNGKLVQDHNGGASEHVCTATVRDLTFSPMPANP
jgi:hypothetical protein